MTSIFLPVYIGIWINIKLRIVYNVTYSTMNVRSYRLTNLIDGIDQNMLKRVSNLMSPSNNRCLGTSESNASSATFDAINLDSDKSDDL